MGAPAITSLPITRLRKRLLDWFADNQRALPWRGSRDPYAIWVSEIMLQQTRVATVVERYKTFLTVFPTVERLAEAEEQVVLALWSGLGYYRRARMLHEAARLVVAGHGGVMPESAAQLRRLPGIGDYTAAAIASIAHGEAVAVVDGNVERVVRRLAGLGSEEARAQSALKKQTAAIAAALVDRDNPGDFNQAMMELGATVCLPRNPLCMHCPVERFCLTRGEHPTKKRAPMRTEPLACCLALRTGVDGTEILLEQRAATETVMPGMWQLPVLHTAQTLQEPPMMRVRHAIMQVNYDVRVHAVDEDVAESIACPGGERLWATLEQAATMALTGLARKVLLRAKLMPAVATIGAEAITVITQE